MWKILALAFLAVVNAGYYEDLTARQVPEIMKQKPKWVAGHNKRFAGHTKEQLARLAGTKLDNKHTGAPKVYPQMVGDALPDTFDARTQWPQCPLIAFIRDQADCGSCWAVSSSAAMGDRDCIHSNGADQVYLSDEDTMTCCSYCGSGCDGGYPLMAWRYWTSTGVVTGGPYDSKEGCQPYEIPPESLAKATARKPEDTPACAKSCESGYDKTYDGDKHKGGSYYQVGNGVTGMQQELFDNGPIVSAFTVYEDFYNYVSGVYHHVSGGVVGGHAVKVVGWGTEDNTPYWLVANSWNASWASLGGFFKIIRGTNDCGFESSISAGQAK
jgi:cathepsin B